MRIISFFLLIFLLVTACGKNERYIQVSGKISDQGFNKAGDAVTVKLKSSKIESGVFNSNYTEVASAITDASGNFSMEVLVEKASGYRFLVSKTDYFESEIDVTTETFEKNETFTANYDIYPKAIIKLVVNNTSPQGLDDEIKYRFTDIEQECKTCCNNSTITGSGPDYSSTSECDVRGQKMFHINWVVSKKGNQNLYSDSIWVEAFKTTTYNINY